LLIGGGDEARNFNSSSCPSETRQSWELGVGEEQSQQHIHAAGLVECFPGTAADKAIMFFAQGVSRKFRYYPIPSSNSF